MSYDVPGHAVGDGGPAATQTALGTRARIVTGLRVLEDDPFRPRPKADIRLIEGTDPRKYRIRIGDYRAIYAVVDREVKVVGIFIRNGAIGNQRRPSRLR
jgi:mRNA-degrading endonuclease RelE of RelBE toxin-antitoxin system